MDNHNTTLEKEVAVHERNQRPENHSNQNNQHFSDGSELIPSEVAKKGLNERETPLTPESEMLEAEGHRKTPSSPGVEPAYRVTDSGLINAYPVSPPMSKVDPNSKKQFRRNIIGFGLAANIALALVVVSLVITGRF